MTIVWKRLSTELFHIDNLDNLVQKLLNCFLYYLREAEFNRFPHDEILRSHNICKENRSWCVTWRPRKCYLKLFFLQINLEFRVISMIFFIKTNLYLKWVSFLPPNQVVKISSNFLCSNSYDIKMFRNFYDYNTYFIIHIRLRLFFFNFYCYSITVVCLFSPSLHPTPAKRVVIFNSPNSTC